MSHNKYVETEIRENKNRKIKRNPSRNRGQSWTYNSIIKTIKEN